MFNTMQLITCIVFHLFGLTSCIPSYDVQQGKIHSLMAHLKEKGYNVLQEHNQINEADFKKRNAGNDKTFMPVKQYLVAAVVSRNELNIEEGQLVKELLEKERLKVYLNEKDSSHRHRKFHGEMIFLHKGGLDEMIKKIQKEMGENTKPIVLLYSFYIPCAHVRNLGYSCSEELGHAADRHKCPMYVFFSEIYPGTDEEQAKQYLAKGETLKLYSEEVSGYVTLIHTPPHDVNEKTFQKLFSECLIRIRMGIVTCVDEDNNRLYVTRFINLLVYGCTHDSNFYGVLIEYSRNDLLNCISKSLSSNFKSCNKCKQTSSAPKADVMIFIFSFCSESIMETDLYLGKVNHLDDSSWQRFECRWKFLTHPLNPNGYSQLPCRAYENPMETCLGNLKDIITRLGNNNRPKVQRLIQLQKKGEVISKGCARKRTLPTPPIGAKRVKRV